MPVPREWWRLDATAQAELVRSGRATPSELVQAAIARVESLNPSINAVVTPLFEEGRRVAAELRESAQPFRGVPFLLKDAGEELAGTRYTMAVPVLRDLDYRSQRTTEFVRRLLAAGFVPIGKANVPEFSSGLTTEPMAFGPTRNPWDRSLSAGGSSGGSAAAVAAGLVAMATGSDATGSLRVPAALCGVATLRPTPGRVPTAVPGEQPSNVWSGFALARSVRDLAALFEIVADDAASSAVEEDSASLRIGLLTGDPDGRAEVEDDCSTAVRVLGGALRELGHEVLEATPPELPGFMARIAPSLTASLGAAREVQLRWVERAIGRPLQPGDLSGDYERLVELPSEEERAARDEAIEVEADGLRAWWDDHDVLVTPVTRQPAWPLGLEDGPQHAGPFVFPFSFTRQPVLTLPVAASASGLPIGVQLVGRSGSDERLLSLGTQIERALPWVDRWPPMAERAEGEALG